MLLGQDVAIDVGHTAAARLLFLKLKGCTDASMLEFASKADFFGVSENFPLALILWDLDFCGELGRRPASGVRSDRAMALISVH